MIEFLYLHVLPAAFDLLPTAMQSHRAEAMILAIALQESKARHRKQLPRKPGGRPGPARGFWQFEAGGGVKGVQTHPQTRRHLEAALVALCYPSTITTAELHAVLEHNDVLACVMARLLLYTEPAPLPGRADVAEGWRQYEANWRPGRPHPDDWPANYARAWGLIEQTGGA